MTLANGEKAVLFRPLEPYETPEAVAAICVSYNKVLDKEIIDPLILIPCFIVIDKME